VSTQPRPQFRPEVHELEARTVLSSGVDYSLAAGVLKVWGTALDDTIRVRQNGSTVTVTAANAHGTSSWNFTGITRVELNGRDGNDLLDCGGTAADALRINARLFGQGGKDTLIGGKGNDWLEAGSISEYADGAGGMDWNAYRWAVNGTRADDVRQGNTPACSFLAALSADARNASLESRIVYVGGFQYDVTLFQAGAGWRRIRVTFDGTTNANDARAAAEGESWVILFQRAFVKMHGNSGIAWPQEAFLALNGSAGTGTGRPPADGDFGMLEAALRQGRAVVTATLYRGAIDPYLVQNHAYSVVAVGRDAYGRPATVTVRNPWGVDGYTYRGPNDGYITLSWTAFKSSMQGLWYA
jgi:hypothetical protein